MTDYRPVFLTSLVMKVFEKLVKEVLVKMKPFLNPLQFAYRAGRDVQDVTLTLLDLLYKHLEGSSNHARLLFVDLSSAFRTIQPSLLLHKLRSSFGVHTRMAAWLLTNRSQRVRVK